MKSKLLLLPAIFIFCCIIFTNNIYASNHLTCEAGDLRAFSQAGEDTNEQAYDVFVCIGGFASEDAARIPMNVTVDCLAHSNSLFGIEICRADNQTVSFTPAHVGEEDRDGDGRIDNYYTCYEIQNINRDVGSYQVIFDTVEGKCSVRGTSKPVNYDTWYEGWLGIIRPGDNFGEDISSPICVDGGINTAFGCIKYDLVGLSKFVLGWSLGVGGGVALVLIAYSGISFMISRGDPRGTNEARSVFIAAISGLLLIIFSAFLLRVIGVDILNLF
jgi:hypothetical protein